MEVVKREAGCLRPRGLGHLRHIVRELVRLMPEAQRETPGVKEMAGYGFGTFMHIVQRPASITKIICAISTSPVLESTRAGRWALPIPCGCSRVDRGKRLLTQWRVVPYTILTFGNRSPRMLGR